MNTCFVVQGFGKKTDFTDGRVLDLDASYAIIKEAVEAAGLTCIRADEIPHSGTIDVPMYQHLLQADLVIADLSTYNVNAAFELGVRYGLRPRATIIVAEEGFKNPFDVGHIVIRRYKHLGEDIGAKEAKRFRDDLRAAITDILGTDVIDSPVYTFLPNLTPPHAQVARMAAPPPTISTPGPVPARPADASVTFNLYKIPASTSLFTVGRNPTMAGSDLRSEDSSLAGLSLGRISPATAGSDFLSAIEETAPEQNEHVEQTAKANLEQAQAKLLASDFTAAGHLLRKVLEQRPNDSFVIQQLALATYKSKKPTPEAALLEARSILLALNPATTNDPETLGLWGAIHKRLWDIKHQDADLSESIDAYGRGFYVKQDYYNGINLAFLLELRALNSLKAGEQEEGITDSILARRIRRDVIKYAEPLSTKDYGNDKRYWILATLWEAAAGLGDEAARDKWASQAMGLKVADWMTETTLSQIQAIQSMQTEIAQLAEQKPANFT
jgi:tetratricopeptide (TPR) repeat protein